MTFWMTFICALAALSLFSLLSLTLPPLSSSLPPSLLTLLTPLSLPPSLSPPQVKGVMVQNIEKVTQRGEKLEDLGERAGQTPYTQSSSYMYIHLHVYIIHVCGD